MSENISIQQEVENKLSDLLKPVEVQNFQSTINYRKAAAVLDYFDLTNINPVNGQHNVTEAFESLLSVSQIVFDENAKPQRSLTDSARREVLEILISENTVVEALQTNSEHPSTLFQELLEASLLRKELPNPEQMGRRELLVYLQIVGILSGIVEGLPSVEDIRRQIGVLDLLNPFRFLLGLTVDNPHGHFFGREAELNRLSDYVGFQTASSALEKIRRGVRDVFGFQQKPPLLIYAPGGMGKSTLLAKFIIDHARFEGEEKIAFVYLDFDRAGLSAEEPVTLLIEALQQLIVQFPENQVSLKKLQSNWNERLSTEIEKNPIPSKQGKFRLNNRYRFIYEFADIIRYLAIENKPLVFVLDTFEEVQYRSRVFVDSLLAFFNELQEKLPTLRVILAGRAEIKSKKYRLDLLALPPFDREAACAYLVKNGVNDPQIAQTLADQFGGVPLTLKLTVELYNLGEVNRQGISDIKTHEWFFKTQEEIIQGQLYDRILSKVGDSVIKKLAHPGLVLRRITPEIILKVLAEPCEVSVPNLETARNLFEKLKEQITLIVPQGNDVLMHRPDVRRVMLGLMIKSKPKVVRKIHLGAVRFYSEFEDNLSRAEEIYHRLSVDFDRSELKTRWRSGLQFSRDALEELPVRAQTYLAARLGLELDEEVWRTADDEDWLLYVKRRGAELVESEEFEEALKLVGERSFDPLANFEIKLIEIKAMQGLGRSLQALKMAEKIFSQVGDAEDQERLAKIVERLEQLRNALYE